MNKKIIAIFLSLVFSGGSVASAVVSPITVCAKSNSKVKVFRNNYSMPSQTPRGLRAGTEQVGGIYNIKKQIYASGGDNIAVAVAMLESKTMDAPDNSKSGDAANYTRFNMNWYGLRVKLYPYLGEYDAYKVKNNFTGSIAKETRTFMSYKRHWGGDFYKVQRGGQSGLYGGYASQIADYEDAIKFIANQLSSHPEWKWDNTRIWVAVPYI